MTNLYEEGKFGGIPREVFPYTDTKNETIFVCSLLEGFTDTTLRERNDKLMTLIMDGELKEEGVSLNTLGEDLLLSVKKELISLTVKDSVFLLTRLSNFDEDERIISEFLHEDYLRMRDYQKSDPRKKRDILIEYVTKLDKLLNTLFDIYYPDKSQMEQWQEALNREISEEETNIKEYEAEIKEHLKAIEQLKEAIETSNVSIDYMKDELDDIQLITKMRVPNIEEDNLNYSSIRTSKKAYIKEFIKEQEIAYQEQKNKAQQEEYTLQKDILDNAFSFFVTEGILKPTKNNLYIMCHQYSDKDFRYVYDLAIEKGLTSPIQFELMRKHLIREGKGQYTDKSGRAFERGKPEFFKKWLPECLK